MKFFQYLKVASYETFGGNIKKTEKFKKKLQPLFQP